MRTIGLIGGMSWESTQDYYRIINTLVKEKLGGLNSAKLILFSVNFQEIEKLQHLGKWDETSVLLTDAAKKVERAGADFILICTNTMHKVADEIQKNIDIPIVHIADATAEILKNEGVKKVGLLGTSFTMEQDFYKGRLKDKYGLKVIIPDENDIKIVHSVIYDELCKGIVLDSSRDEYLRICDKFTQLGCEGVILGCTEIGILINHNNTDIKLFDTTQIHAEKAVNIALEK